MIIAEREHLEDLMSQQAVEIRVKEEKILSKTFRALSSISTYLAAASFGILRASPTYLLGNASYLDKNKKEVDWPADTISVAFREPLESQTVWLVTLTTGWASMAIGFCVLVLVISSWCLIFGTDLAFRGDNQGSMTRAMDGLYAERKWCIRFFLCAVMSTVFGGVAHLGLVMRDKWPRFVPMSYLLIVACVAMAYMRLAVRPRFKFEDGKAKNDQSDLLFAGGFDPEIRRNVETWQEGH